MQGGKLCCYLHHFFSLAGFQQGIFDGRDVKDVWFSLPTEWLHHSPQHQRYDSDRSLWLSKWISSLGNNRQRGRERVKERDRDRQRMRGRTDGERGREESQMEFSEPSGLSALGHSV